MQRLRRWIWIAAIALCAGLTIIPTALVWPFDKRMQAWATDALERMEACNEQAHIRSLRSRAGFRHRWTTFRGR